MSNITLNIVEPGGPTPDPVVPNTGLFTHGIGGPEATIITAVSIVLLLTIVAVVVAMLYKKHKKQGKATKLVSTVDACATVVKSKKRVSAGLAAVALLVSTGTFAGLLVNTGKSNTNAAEGEDGLTLDASSEDLTIEVGDSPVFAVLPVELTVAEATQAGYTLTAYTEDTNLISTTDSSKVIPMVAADEGELVALTDNTYGLALVAPEDKDSEVYTTLSTEIDTPTLITDRDYKATEENDTTTIYYGFYITPDTPYGTYIGSNITYQANPNYITTLSFNGNGSDGGTDMEGMTLLAGDTITLPQNTYTKEGYGFTGWNTVATPTTEDPGTSYADEAEFTASSTESEDVTLYAQWEVPPTYMQDVATWGSTLNQGDTIEAVDSRDGKTYWVAKLADGNIWMTQNLDLDLSTETTLTPANTNITANWTPVNSTIAFTGATAEGWQNSDNVPFSANPGDVYYYTSGSDEDDIQYNSLADCVAANHTEAECKHYHVGNYYNWTAAIASNDSSSYVDGQIGNVTSSICPSGWKLPFHDDNKDSGSSFYKLFSVYSILGTGSYGQYGYAENGFKEVRDWPLYIVRAGNIGASTVENLDEAYLWDDFYSAWSGGFYGGTLRVYDLYIFPSTAGTRGAGIPIRCLAQ